MSEREMKILETIAEALPGMSDFEKGHLLGTAEQMARNNEKKEEPEQIAPVA